VPPPTSIQAPSRTADTRNLLGQYGWLLLSRVLSAALQSATLVLLARWTGPATFGLAASVTGVLILVGTVADFGLSSLLLRNQSADEQSAATSTILRLNLLISGGLTIAVGVGLTVLALTTSRSGLLMLLPLAVWMAAEKNGDVWLSLATAAGRTHLVTVSLLVRRGLSLVLFVLLAQALAAPLAFALALAIGSVTANLVMRTNIPVRAAPHDVSYRSVARAALPFLLNSLAAMVRNVDVAIVSAAAGPVAAGIYAVPSRLASPLRMLPTTMSPLIVRYAALGTRPALGAVARMSALMMIVMPGALAVIVAFAPTIIELVLGASYTAAVLPLRIMCLGLVFAFAISLETSYLQGRGEERFVGRVGLVVVVVTVCGLFFGAMLGGSTGAAVAASATFVVHFALLVGRTVTCIRRVMR
jgi:O-antigen/teichoic acid export membrane protein